MDDICALLVFSSNARSITRVTLSQAHACASTILVDELDTGRLGPLFTRVSGWVASCPFPRRARLPIVSNGENATPSLHLRATHITTMRRKALIRLTRRSEGMKAARSIVQELIRYGDPPRGIAIVVNEAPSTRPEILTGLPTLL
jgi:hypothetical protein